MKNDIKMVAYAERDSHGSREDNVLTHDEGRRTGGGCGVIALVGREE
jgi:hypothetical protein